MPAICKGACLNGYETKGGGSLGNRGRSSYREGYKYCQACTTFIRWDGLFCPCCSMRLRRRAKHTKYRGELLATGKRL